MFPMHSSRVKPIWGTIMAKQAVLLPSRRFLHEHMPWSREGIFRRPEWILPSSLQKYWNVQRSPILHQPSLHASMIPKAPWYSRAKHASSPPFPALSVWEQLPQLARRLVRAIWFGRIVRSCRAVDAELCHVFVCFFSTSLLTISPRFRSRWCLLFRHVPDKTCYVYVCVRDRRFRESIIIRPSRLGRLYLLHRISNKYRIE